MMRDGALAGGAARKISLDSLRGKKGQEHVTFKRIFDKLPQLERCNNYLKMK